MFHSFKDSIQWQINWAVRIHSAHVDMNMEPTLHAHTDSTLLVTAYFDRPLSMIVTETDTTQVVASPSRGILFLELDREGRALSHYILSSLTPEGGIESREYFTALHAWFARDNSGDAFLGGSMRDLVRLVVEGDTMDFVSPPAAEARAYVAGLNAEYDMSWCRVFPSTLYSDIQHVIPDGSGGVYAAGFFRGSMSLEINGVDTVFSMEGTGPFDTELFVARLDSTGQVLWVRHLGGRALQHAPGTLALSRDAAGRVVLMGVALGDLYADPPIRQKRILQVGDRATLFHVRINPDGAMKCAVPLAWSGLPFVETDSASFMHVSGMRFMNAEKLWVWAAMRGPVVLHGSDTLEMYPGSWLGTHTGDLDVCPEYPCAWVTLSPCGDTLIACGATGSRWDWYLGDSLVQSGPDTVLGVGGPGTYRVVVHLDPECPYQRPDTAMIGVPPRMEHDATVFLCAGDTLDLQGEPVTEPGHYTVHLTSHQGCDSIVHVEVVVLSMPAWQTVWDTVVAPGVEITLPGPEAAHYIYEWIPSAGLSCASCPQPAWTADSSQTWVLTVSDTAGCDTMSLAFRVRLAIGMVEVPNLFTPNGDGVNDMFRPVIQAGTGEGIRYAAMRVYSRWGEEVYAGGGTSPSWDGTHMGKACPSDVYGWILEVEYPGGRREVLRGEVTLMR